MKHGRTVTCPVCGRAAQVWRGTPAKIGWHAPVKSAALSRDGFALSCSGFGLPIAAASSAK